MAQYDKNEMIRILKTTYGARLRVDESLSRHCTWGVGGRADAWLGVEHEDEVITLVAQTLQHNWPLMFVGNGTNTLYSDAGARGLVLQNNLNDWKLIEEDGEKGVIRASAGVNLPRLVLELASQGWSGIEFGAGIPASIGGAVVSNAGAHGRSFQDVVRAVWVLEIHPETSQSEVKEYSLADLGLAYRQSRFKLDRKIRFDDQGASILPKRDIVEPSEIILSVEFNVEKENPEAVQAKVAQYRRHRKETQPVQPSAGSVFKNPPGTFSGKLIEEAGLKGFTIGRAQISPKHANFIVNLGGATAGDICQLITAARGKVLEKSGVALEPEIELRGDWND